jgi:hypothetical protein
MIAPNWMPPGEWALLLALASQLFQCRPAQSAPSEEEEGEACHSCKFDATPKDLAALAASDLLETLCLINAKPLASTQSSVEKLRITKQLSLIAAIGGSKNPPRYRGWDSQVESLTIERSGGGCEAQRSVRWNRQVACEIEHARIPLTDRQCSDTFACLRAAIPAGVGPPAWCNRPGTDGTEYWAEIFDSDHRGACAWFDETPWCVADAIMSHTAYQ